MATITGTIGNDVITEDDLTTGIVGGIPSSAHDAIAGGGGDDLIDGSGGNDTLRGDAGNDTLIGGDGNDIVDTSPTSYGNDLLLGGAGNDTLFAYQADTLDGGTGNDLLQVWNDQIYSLQGGAGTDTLSIAASYWYSGSFSLAANGIEVIQGNGGTIYGGAGNDAIDLTGITLVQVANIDGQAGNDTIKGFNISASVGGGVGEDSIVGGIGNDTLRGDTGNDTLIGGDGNDILDIQSSSTGNDSLSGGAGNDTLFAYQGDTIDGGAGDDLIQVWSDQVYTLQGGADIDTVSIASSYWYLGNFSLAANGIEVINGNGQGIYGTVGNETINFAGITLNQVAFIDGQGGNDTLSGFTAAAAVYGGVGEDSVTGSSGNDTLRGDSGNDTLIGGNGNDLLDIQSSSTGNDSLSGGAGNDTLFAYQGDTIDGGAGNDLIQVWSDQVYTLNGGADIDTVSIASSYWYLGNFSLAANGIEVINGNGQGIYGTAGNETINVAGIALNQVAFIDGQGGNDTLSGFTAAAAVYGGVGEDSVTGSSGNDTLRGDSGNDTLIGGNGNDLLDIQSSSTGNDSLSGGAGNDTLFAYQGDTIDGGAGNDLIQVWSDQVYTLNGGADIDTVSIASSYWYLGNFSLAANGIEVINGNGQGIYGTAGNETINVAGIALNQVAFIDGQGGNDTLSGFTAAAAVYGGVGEDSVTGSSGNDTLRGDSGNDTLIGGNGNDLLDIQSSSTGNDSLSGGAGNDTLFAYQGDTIDGGAGNDLIQVWSDQVYTLQGGTEIDTVSIASSYWNLGNFSLAANGIEVIDGNGEEIYGTASNDAIDFTGVAVNSVTFIDGQGGNDTLTGSAGNDSLYGSSGNDVLIGGAGDDYLHGGAELDSFDGGDGNDTLDFSFSGTGGSVSLPAGVTGIGGINETFLSIENLIGSSGSDTIIGSAGANRLDGYYGNDSISAGDGDDTVSGGFGLDTMNGGVGNDTVDFSFLAAANGVDLNLVTQVATTVGVGAESILAFENAIGGGGNDTVTGTVAANRLDGSAGNDSILAGDGNDTLTGGLGNDTLNGQGGTDTVDYTYALGGLIDLAAGTANFGATDQDTLVSIEQVLGSNGRDTIFGAAGADSIDGARSNDSVLGGGGNDTLWGGVGNDTLGGDAGNDSLLGGNGNDSLLGGIGNDILNGQAGVDSLAGGAGDDLFIYDGTLDTLVEAVGEGIDRVNSSVSFTLALGNNIEDVTLTGTAADATGNELNNRLTGNASANRLAGRAGNDTLLGGVGADTLLGGAGDDSLNGGTELDTASYADAAAAVTVNLSVTLAQNTLGAGTDILSAMENLAGSAFNDTLTGSVAANVLSGGGGNDSLNGGDGNDTLFGEAGNDTLNGQVGTDSLVGGLGNDVYVFDGTADVFVEAAGEGTDRVDSALSFTLAAGNNIESVTLTGVAAVNATGNASGNVLIGNAAANTLSGLAGNDTLTGGAGTDRFRFVSPAQGLDSLTDFVSGSDKIQVVSPNFGNLPTLLTPSRLVAAGAPLLNGDAVFIYNGVTGALSFDVDGNGVGAAVQFAALTGPKTLVVGDFQVVAT